MHLQKPMLGTQLDWSNPLNRGLVMHLAMNEGHGDRVQDLSLYGNHGKLHNFAYPPTHESGWNPGKDGIALNFASNNYVGVGSKSSLDFNASGDLTYEVLFRVDTLPSVHGANMFILVKLGVNSGYFVGIDQWTNKLEATNPDGWSNTRGNTAIATGRYYHAIYVYSNQVVSFYIDGVPDGSGSAGTFVSSQAASTVGSSSNNLVGQISFVRNLNRAYTAKEVLERYMNPYGVYLEA